MKKKSRRKIGGHRPPLQAEQQETAKVVAIAGDVAELNARELEIRDRLGTINAEAARLSAELHGSQVRREQLRREFDAASEPG